MTSKKKDSNSPGMNKNWVHPPNALTQGHVIYNVKFLGQTEVDQPKGANVVKEAIRKLKFSRHIRKAEGNKPRKMELTISAEGIGLQDPKTKERLHTYALHRISYCADDKTDKKICAFIAKEQTTNKHLCFVLDSDKCAEEITLTVGQAFDLAYRKFLDTSGRDMEMKKQFIMLQKRVQEVEAENTKLRKRVAELESLTGQKSTILDSTASTNADTSSTVVSGATDKPQATLQQQAEQHVQQTQAAQSDSLFEMEPFSPTGAGTHNGFPVNKSSSGMALPLSSPPGPVPPALAPPPPVPARQRPQAGVSSTPPPTHPPPQPVPASKQIDPFGSAPFGSTVPVESSNPFQMGTDYDKAISHLDRQMAEIKEGFGSGLTMGKDDFSLADLDPLNQK